MDFFEQFASLLQEIGFSGLCDIAIVTLVIYTFIMGLKRTRRSGLIFAGIVIIGTVYLMARQFNLVLTAALLQGFFTVILVALVVIFQEDLRYFFEQVATWWLVRGLPFYKRRPKRLPRQEVEILARTIGDLARANIGALVVLQGKDTIARHLNGGQEVHGLLSEVLLKSIFDPHSIGHDGAVVVNGPLIEKLGCHLPLSGSLEKLFHRGTRHAAALGLSERSDALCIVVSEERGTISIARRGDIATVSTSAQLAGVLESFYEEIAPQKKMSSWRRLFLVNYREKAISFVLAVGLWVMLGFSAQVTNRSFEVPVNYSQLPNHLAIVGAAPDKVRVTLSGPRRAFAFLKPDSIRLALPLGDIKKGRHKFAITDHALSYPPGLTLQDFEPRQVFLDVESKSPVGNNAR